MHQIPQHRRRFTGRRAAATLVVAGLALAACGSDDDAADAPADTATDTQADTATTEPDGTDPATTEPESTEPGATAPASSEPGSTSAASGEFATMDEIAALCPAETAPDSIVFSTFPGQDVSIDPVTEAFTEATGVDVEWLGNSLGDRLTKMAAESGSPTIDVALVPIAEVPGLLAQGITEETNTELPNYEQLIDVAKVDGGYGVSVLQFGITYNPELITETPDSWLDLLDEEYAGLIALPAMPNSGGYAFLSMLSIIDGGDETDLTGAIDQVADFRDNVVMFIESSVNHEEQISNGEFGMYIDIGGVASRAINERGLPVEFVVPDEGGPVSMNTLVIPAGSDHTGCAEAFVAFMLGAEAQQQWAEGLYYGTTSSIVDFPDELDAVLYPVPGDDSTIVPLDWTAISTNGPDTVDYWNRTVTS
jgi:putative spermidine/putrescine transport system substrate-binding protein